MKMAKKGNYYSLKNILQVRADYYMIFGERSNGKTYSVLEYALKKWIDTKEEFAIIRRYDEDFKRGRGQKMVDTLIINGLGENVVEKLTKGKYNYIQYYSRCWFICKRENDKIVDKYEIPIGYAFSLGDMEHDKSTSYNNVTTILFDEFITRTFYYPDEFVIFTNVLSTIIRDRDNVSIFMCGNTINLYGCPYFKEMGIDVRKMKPDDIDVYSYGESELKVAVEYASVPDKKHPKKSNKYFAFNNPKLQVITGGDGKSPIWEMEFYPHLPCKYVPKDVLYTYFIKFDDEVVQCEIIMKGDLLFTYIHKKTTPIKYDGYSIIYQQEYDARPYIKRRITKPTSDVENKILEFFVKSKVFYQTNEVGELVRAYIMWCRTIN